MLSTISILLLTYLCLSIFLNINIAEGSQIPQFVEVEVKSGDTLWELAKTFGPKNKDIRYSIYEISSLNNLTSLDIFPGQVIKIPIH